MKKITLSAAIMALAMMGCSDAGLDNSVASTSEIKSEQVQSSANEPLVLARFATGFYRDEPLTGGNIPNVGNGYARYSYMSQVGIQVQMQTYYDGVNAVGAYHVMNVPNNPLTNIPNYPSHIRIMTLPLYNCKWDHGEAYCHKPGRNPSNERLVDEMRLYPNTVGLTVVADDIIPQSLGDENKLCVVSYFQGVWNEGTSVEVGLTAKTYNGTQLQADPALAAAVYEKYLKPYVANHNSLY